MLVQKTEEELKRKLDWQAAIHRDTAHPHLRLLFNGIDSQGKEYKFPKRLIRNGKFREICQDILTEVKGERTEEQVQSARDARPLADRLTEFDEMIEKIAIPFPQEENNPEAWKVPVNNESVTPEIKKRLDHLKSIGLCKFENESYVLEKDWKRHITMIGRYNTYLDARQYIAKDKEFLMFDGENKHRVSGKILKLYRMNDENVWSNAVVIEDKGGNGIFVPVLNARSFDDFCIGDEVDIVSVEGTQGKTRVKIYPSRTPEEMKEIVRNRKGKDEKRGQEERLKELIEKVTKDTGFKGIMENNNEGEYIER